MELRSWQDEIRALAHDLLHLETNTIVAEGITGRKMPSYPHALLDIAHRYLNFLEGKYNVELLQYWRLARGETDETKKRRRLKSPDGVDEQGEGKPPVFKSDPESLWAKKIKNDADTFMRLQYAAAYVLTHIKEAAAAGAENTEKNRLVLVRIKRNCDAIIGLVKTFERLDKNFIGVSRGELLFLEKHPPQAPTELNIQLRKMWDIATDEIVLQTVLQLDGDVMNRIKLGLDLEANAPLLKAHKEIMDLGIKNWQKMFALALELLGGIFKALLGR